MTTSVPNNLRRVGIIVISVVVIILIAIIALAALFKPRVDEIFSDIVRVTCVYNIKVIAFADANGDGIQSADEAGVAGAAITIQHSEPGRDSTPELKLTDASGMATLSADKYCIPSDMLTVNAVPPSGYSATTPLSFGPYPVPAIFVAEQQTRVAANPIPSVLYVGLHQS